MEQQNISQQWRTQQIQILISTTCALCGNENSNCCCVILCGQVYSLINIVQAMGRLCPVQKFKTSSFEIVLDQKNSEEIKQQESLDNEYCNILLAKGLLSEETKKMLNYFGEFLYIQLGEYNNVSMSFTQYVTTFWNTYG